MSVPTQCSGVATTFVLCALDEGIRLDDKSALPDTPASRPEVHDVLPDRCYTASLGIREVQMRRLETGKSCVATAIITQEAKVKASAAASDL